MDEGKCITSEAPYKMNGVVRVMFDEGERKLDNETFEYVSDPVVFTVEPGLIGGGQMRSPKGIVAGGVKIRVTGENFDTVQHPQIYVADETGRRFYGVR
jgi:plexin A